MLRPAAQWWLISEFLCHFDSGDLLNELVLLVYMLLVVGQASALAVDCARLICPLPNPSFAPVCLHSSHSLDSLVARQPPCAHARACVQIKIGRASRRERV